MEIYPFFKILGPNSSQTEHSGCILVKGIKICLNSKIKQDLEFMQEDFIKSFLVNRLTS